MNIFKPFRSAYMKNDSNELKNTNQIKISTSYPCCEKLYIYEKNCKLVLQNAFYKSINSKENNGKKFKFNLTKESFIYN